MRGGMASAEELASRVREEVHKGRREEARKIAQSAMHSVQRASLLKALHPDKVHGGSSSADVVAEAFRLVNEETKSPHGYPADGTVRASECTGDVRDEECMLAEVEHLRQRLRELNRYSGMDPNEVARERQWLRTRVHQLVDSLAQRASCRY